MGKIDNNSSIKLTLRHRIPNANITIGNGIDPVKGPLREIMQQINLFSVIIKSQCIEYSAHFHPVKKCAFFKLRHVSN